MTAPREVKAALEYLEDVTDAVVLTKEVEGHVIAVVLPSMRHRERDPSFSDSEAARLWALCADAVAGLVSAMRNQLPCSSVASVVVHKAILIVAGNPQEARAFAAERGLGAEGRNRWRFVSGPHDFEGLVNPTIEWTGSWQARADANELFRAAQVCTRPARGEFHQ